APDTPPKRAATFRPTSPEIPNDAEEETRPYGARGGLACARAACALAAEEGQEEARQRAGRRRPGRPHAARAAPERPAALRRAALGRGGRGAAQGEDRAARRPARGAEAARPERGPHPRLRALREAAAVPRRGRPAPRAALHGRQPARQDHGRRLRGRLPRDRALPRLVG